MKNYLVRFLIIISVISLTSCARQKSYTNPSDFLPSYVSSVKNNQGYVFYENKLFFQELTPLQLKVMQTRKFNKPFLQVASGIKTMCDDSGAKFQTSDALQCTFPVNKIFMITGSSNENKYFTVKYFLEAKGQETIVRIRMYGNDRNFGSPETAQFTIDSLYHAQFKKIADSLFINAIQLNPQEMN